ncbi:MAG: extracellular solute-binding protein [Geodermatophilaceae bacterium]|nr:extracellular solute-binding protein [Geodermatophilaceae bacterium]
MRRRVLSTLAVISLGATVAGCGGDSAPSAEDAAAATGPIDIWYANNPEEVAWGEAMIEAWNAENPDAEVTGQEIPAGTSSEEVITAAITAGNAPCLIYNTAPAAVPGFERQGGLVSLSEFDDGAEFIETRTGERSAQYQSTDGGYYQMPWKTNPSMIFYNKDVFAAAGLDAENPPLASYDEFLATSQTLVDSGEVQAAIWPAASSEFFQSWFDFYPLFIAASDGQQLVEDGESQFNNPAGIDAAGLWAQMYERGLTPNENYEGDSFNDQVAAMSIVGPWAIAVYEDVNWGVVPVPTPAGAAPEEVSTFSDEKSVGMFTACENRGTAWEYLKFTMSEEADGQLLELTGQMPMRDELPTTYPDYFSANPDYEIFADQAARTVEVPNVANSIEIWQTFRNAYSSAVIFGEGDVATAFDATAEEINNLASEN